MAIKTRTDPSDTRTGDAVAARLAPRQPRIARCVESIHCDYPTPTLRSNPWNEQGNSS